MALAYVLDEHLRGPLWGAIQRHNSHSEFLIDATRVGDVEELALGTPDRELLLWCERASRILVTRDYSTMPEHVEAHLGSGNRCPGVMALRPHARIDAVVQFLLFAAHASDAAEWENKISYIP